MRKARIIATLGPASRAPERLTALIAAGMDVARLNFSHGTHDEHRAAFDAVRRASEAAGRPVAVMQDLQGPKIRVGKLPGGPRELAEGDDVVVDCGPHPDSSAIPCTYDGLAAAVREGDPVLLADGRLRLVVQSVSGTQVRCRVLRGGTLSDHKGINLPGAVPSIPALTPKDLDDVAFGVELGVDCVAASFVRSADDVRTVRRHAGGLPVIAKIEKPQAVERLDEICEASDGILVARGDLGVEMALEQVPGVQKTAVEKANRLGKMTVVATQMLESMIESPVPTRAEVSDVANAVLDGADAVMLSAESAVGRYPELAVRTMASIVEAAEASPRFLARRADEPAEGRGGFPMAVAKAAVAAAWQLGIRTVACYTRRGETARVMSEFHWPGAVVAFTPSLQTWYRLALYRGVSARRTGEFGSTDEMIRGLVSALVEAGDAHPGQEILLCSAVPPDRPSAGTMMMQLLRV